MRRAALAVLLALPGVVGPAAVASSVACASTEGPRAVLVVDTGSQDRDLCVALDAGSVSGIRLIQLADAQHGLQYRLGHGGGAVCQLAGVGPSEGECFADYPDFWGYWRWQGGAWLWSSTGAGSTTVVDGSVEGWSWGSGQDGSTHPQPPVRAFEDVCGSPPSSPAPSSTSGSAGGGGSGSSGGGSGGGGSRPGSDGGSPGSAGPQGSGGSDAVAGGSSTSPPPSPGDALAPAGTATPGATAPVGAATSPDAPEATPLAAGGPPPEDRALEGVVAAVVAMSAFVGMGWIVLRARRRAA